jgi:hypothetical protein
MGAINYFTSDYITLGYLDYSQQDFNDEYTLDDYYTYEDDDYTQIKYLLENERFNYFHVTLKPGYYSGFSLDIEYNFSYCLDDYFEKLEAQKEITRIKNFMLYIVDNFNMCAVYPGWCTGYADHKTTIKEISAAVAAMRDDVKSTPTYYTLKLAGEC